MSIVVKAFFIVFLLMILAPLVIASLVEKYGEWRDEP